jgi:D-glycero-D-manno-heptose 1,7-bisphosphate phosphatase
MGHLNQAVVLVGGRGTRLGARTETVPKPMLIIGGTPFLEYLLWFLACSRIERVVLCTGYLGGTIRAHFQDGADLGLRLEYSEEVQPAGTGGALLAARRQLGPEFYVLNGDTILDVHLEELSDLLRFRPEALGAIALRRVEDAGRYGQVCLKGDRIRSFDEKVPSGEGLISGGVYCMKRRALDYLPSPPCSLEKDLFPALARRGELLGLAREGYFIDIGLPETLTQAEVELPRWRASKNQVAGEPT